MDTPILDGIRKRAGWGPKLANGFSTMMTGGHLAPFNPIASGHRAIRGISNMAMGKRVMPTKGQKIHNIGMGFLQGPI